MRVAKARKRKATEVWLHPGDSGLKGWHAAGSDFCQFGIEGSDTQWCPQRSVLFRKVLLKRKRGKK